MIMVPDRTSSNGRRNLMSIEEENSFVVNLNFFPFPGKYGRKQKSTQARCQDGNEGRGGPLPTPPKKHTTWSS